MDKEEARFILRSFRPDGADVGDHDFAEALAMATADRELGEWLAAERAFDAEFARAIGAVALPTTLREDILGCLTGERGDFPQAESEDDMRMIGALSSIQPPPRMREEILTAMAQTAHAGRLSAWRVWALPAAAAAGIAMAFWVKLPMASAPADPVATAVSRQVRAEVVEAGFIKVLESPAFELDEKREDRTVLIQHLRERKLPCPGCLPRGLENVKSIGCRELVIDGKRGSVMCFQEGENGVVHLVVFRRQDIEGEVPQKSRPHLVQNGRWATAHWQDDQKVFILVGATDVGKLASLL